MNKIGWMAAAGLLALTAGAETRITIVPAPAIPVNRRVFGNNQLAYQNAGNAATGGNHNSYGYLYLFKDKLRYGWQKKEPRSIYCYEQYWRRTC